MFGALVSRMLPLVPKSVVRQVAKRYVAGESIDEALEAVRRLNSKGFCATLDILGEDAVNEAAADATRDGYLEILDRILDESLDSNISVKPTHLGLRLDPEKANERLFSLAERAADTDNFVRLDMEDATVTDATLEIQRVADERYGTVGTVLQAYLRRTLEDARRLAGRRADVRICKGIYRESPKIAFQKRGEIRRNFVDVARTLMEGDGTYCAFATHDRKLVADLVELVDRQSFPKSRCEFQVLLGVPVESMLDGLVERGFKVRVYVPFGKEWYPYSVRRLKENPRLAAYIVKHMFTPEARR